MNEWHPAERMIKQHFWIMQFEQLGHEAVKSACGLVVYSARIIRNRSFSKINKKFCQKCIDKTQKLSSSSISSRMPIAK